MATEAPNGPSSAFPPPPIYYHSFTPTNLTTLQSLLAQYGTPDAIPTEKLTGGLEHLVPPPSPDGSYWAFNEHWMVPERHPSLEETGVQKLYGNNSTGSEEGGEKEKEKSIDRAVELRRLSKSLLLNFLELTGVLGIAPENFHQKTTDMETILYNMHHLINEYRPHQARETLCLNMEEQLEKIRRETEENRRAVEKVEIVLASLEGFAERAEEIAREVGDKKGEKKSEGGMEEARKRDGETWRLILR
ncbi:Mediator of RNA polymerase II transcription subunit 7 [Rhizina undulata]